MSLRDGTGAVVTNGGGVSDHGLLTGLADDDHAQYSRADGTRAFTAVVSGVTPTAAAHIATKAYADKKSRAYKHIGTTNEVRICCGHIGSGAALTTGSPVVGTLYAIPWKSPASGTLDRLTFEVTTLAVAGVARVGLYTYTSDTNIYPDALVVDGGDTSTATTGVKDATISHVIEPDKLYYAVFLCGVLASTIRCMNPANVDQNILGWRTTLGANFGATSLTVAQAYGALPATFPAGAAFVMAAPLPAVFARYSA